MRNICVIDISFFMSYILPYEDSSQIDLSIYDVYVPTIFFLECSNVLRTNYKKKEEHKDCLRLFKQLPFVVDNFSSIKESLHTIYELSKNEDLTTYDASYLELSIRLNASLGTLDNDLKRAAFNQNVHLIS